MTRFVDGPAAGKTLLLKRAPLFLRAVQTASGEWDALDQLDDEPQAGEHIYVYQRSGPPLRAHINFGRRGCGFFEGGEYRLAAAQPPDDVLRDRVSWRAWAQGHAGAQA